MGFDQVAVVDFGDRNSLIITPALTQVLWTEELEFGPLNPDDCDSFVVKSRVHFRRGFDETGYAKTIIIVDAPGPFVGTVHLDALPHENVTLSDYYPYGTPPDRQCGAIVSSIITLDIRFAGAAIVKWDLLIATLGRRLATRTYQDQALRAGRNLSPRSSRAAYVRTRCD